MGMLSSAEDLLEVLLSEFGLSDDKLGELIEDLIELDIVLVLGEVLIVAEGVSEVALAVQQLVEVPQEEFQLADVAVLLVFADALHEDLVDRLEPGYEVTVHVLHLRVLGEQSREVGVGVQVVVVAHEVLPQEDAGVEAGAHFGVDLFGVIHEFFQFLGEGDHGFGEGGEQAFDEVEIFVVLAAVDGDGLALEVVEGDLEVDLFELVYEPFSLLELVQLHLQLQSALNITNRTYAYLHP